MGHRWNDNDREKPAPVPLRPPHAAHELARDSNLVLAGRDKRLTP